MGPVASADLDGDGRTDLAFASFDGLLVMLGFGDGTFGPTGRYLVPGFPGSLVAADFNGDHRPDIAALTSSPPGVTVLLNRTSTGPNRPPVAATSGSVQAECASPTATPVRLDGSASSDPDSVPFTYDDIVRFEWFEDYSTGSQRLVGTGMIASVPFAPGDHALTLKVIDSAGAISTAPLLVRVVDTLPPILTAEFSPTSLWPANHRMVDVQATVLAVDACGVAEFVLVALESNEPDDAMGTGDGNTIGDIQNVTPGTPDVNFSVRAERDAGGSGRVYTATYTARDSLGREASFRFDLAVCRICPQEISPSLSQGIGGTSIAWTEIPGASAYRLAWGNVADLSDAGDFYDLGFVQVLLESQGSAERAAIDPEIPSPGTAYFYVIDAAAEGSWISYGEESADKERRPR